MRALANQDQPRVAQAIEHAAQGVGLRQEPHGRVSHNVDGVITLSGTIAVPRAAAAGVRLKTVQRRVAAGQPVKVKLGLSRRFVRCAER